MEGAADREDTRPPARGLIPSIRGMLRPAVLKGGLSRWLHLIGVYAKIANGGRLIQRPIVRTRRWASASKKHSSRSVCVSRAIVGVLILHLASRHMPLGRVRPHRLRSRNADMRSTCGEGVDGSRHRFHLALCLGRPRVFMCHTQTSA